MRPKLEFASVIWMHKYKTQLNEAEQNTTQLLRHLYLKNTINCRITEQSEKLNLGQNLRSCH